MDLYTRNGLSTQMQRNGRNSYIKICTLRVFFIFYIIIILIPESHVTFRNLHLWFALFFNVQYNSTCMLRYQTIQSFIIIIYLCFVSDFFFIIYEYECWYGAMCVLYEVLVLLYGHKMHCVKKVFHTLVSRYVLMKQLHLGIYADGKDEFKLKNL